MTCNETKESLTTFKGETDRQLKEIETIKVPSWSNSQYPFFYIFVHNRSFLDILPNFNILPTLELTFFGPLFPRIYQGYKFSLFQVLVENWSKWRHLVKNTTQVEIIITISVENRIKSDKNFDSYMYIRTIFYTKNNCYYNFNLCCIFEKMTSFTQILDQDLEQGELMAAVNSRK